jgi:rRNA-processing protein CGR1
MKSKKETTSGELDRPADYSWKDVPRGRPKSGRLWKKPRPVSLSKVTKSKPLKTSWDKKMKERAEKKSIKEYERNLKLDIKKKLEEKRKRQELKLKRQMEKDRLSEIVQVVKSATKMKRMKKKQLRQIKKI